MPSLHLNPESGLPASRQLAQHVHSRIDQGELRPGDRLPSLRKAAAAAGVNVNTVRAAYTHLERAGAAVTQQGRGTFVANPPPEIGDAKTRRVLQEEIAKFEAQLVRLPALPPPGERSDVAASTTRPPAAVPRLLSIDELTAVRDALSEQVRVLREAREAIARQIQEDRRAPIRTPSRRSSSSVADVQVRWT